MALASVVAISGPTPSNGPCNGFAHIKIMKFRPLPKDSFDTVSSTPSLAILDTTTYLYSHILSLLFLSEDGSTD
jgi:hypothetical protein